MGGGNESYIGNELGSGSFSSMSQKRLLSLPAQLHIGGTSFGRAFFIQEDVMMKRMLSGIKPTGRVTLGNYIGAIKPFVQFQNEYEMIIFVANLH